MGDDYIRYYTRYADYVEDSHKVFLWNHLEPVRDSLEFDSPYDSFDFIEIENAFFGAGYTIDSFPSLYDMFGKFMAGLDIDVLYDQIATETLDGDVVHSAVSAEATRLSDELEDVAAPRFQAGMRDMNAVMSSTFVLGNTILENERIKALSKYTSDLQIKLLPVTIERWKRHLEWNDKVVDRYINIVRLYFSAAMDVSITNYDINAKNKVWPFTIYEYFRSCLGGMQGATTSGCSEPGPGRAMKTIGGAMAGASTGAQVGGWPGAIVGGIAGALYGAFS